MSSDVVVREAVAEDVDAIRAIAQAQPNAPQWHEDIYREMLYDTRRALMVAVCDEITVGFVAIAQLLDEAEIESVVVTTGRERQGIGGALCKAAVRWTKARSVSSVWLEVRSSNRSARAFYEAMDYKSCGVRRSYYTAPVEDAVTMRLLI